MKSDATAAKKPKKVKKFYRLTWAPEGKPIGVVEAEDPSAARRLAPQPYRRYLGEIGVEEFHEDARPGANRAGARIAEPLDIEDADAEGEARGDDDNTSSDRDSRDDRDSSSSTAETDADAWGKLLEQLVGALESSDLDWTPDIVNAEATEHAIIGEEKLRTLLGHVVDPSELDDVVTVLTSPEGMAVLADVLVQQGFGDVAHPSAGGQHVILFRGMPEVDAGTAADTTAGAEAAAGLFP